MAKDTDVFIENFIGELDGDVVAFEAFAAFVGEVGISAVGLVREPIGVSKVRGEGLEWIIAGTEVGLDRA